MVGEQGLGALAGDAPEGLLQVRQGVERLADEAGLVTLLHVAAGFDREQGQDVAVGYRLTRGRAAANGHAQALFGKE